MIWHSSKLSDVQKELGVDFENGLTAEKAGERLAGYGPNRLREKKLPTFFERFAAQLKDTMVMILMAAAAISVIVTLWEGHNDWIEPIVIVAIVVLNALLGVIQESKAEQALAALKNLSTPNANVMRDGKVCVVPAADLVPGDVMMLEAGDYIPADGRLISCHSLHCEEAALTGESLAVEKQSDAKLADIAPLGDRLNMVYSGCVVSYGRACAVVTETGMGTEMGKIASLLENQEEIVTPLQQKLARLGKNLGFLALTICGIILVVGLFTKQPPMEMVMTSISLAVAAIPEGLPAIVTIALALGVQRMVKKNAIIRRLPAVETLGSASVICSDKTGTLTQNRMTLVKMYSKGNIIDINDADDTKAANLLTYAALCCDARLEVEGNDVKQIGDPTETAIVHAAYKVTGPDALRLNDLFPRLSEIPFDSERKLMSTVNIIDGKPVAIVKGAPDVLLSRCSRPDLKNILAANEQMAGEALRVLAIGYRTLSEVPTNPTSEELETDLKFLGLVGMIDPPRPEAKDAVAKSASAGIKTVMITGDHITTACAIAKQLGILDGNALAVTGTQLAEMSDTELDAKIADILVYARVSPEDKIRIVNAWKKRGDVVAMTGDGVNDAPALKAADIGCAMGITGTDVAKGASDITLTDDNFATIVTAVKEGRGIFDNIKKSVHFLLSCNLGEILTVFVAMLVGWGTPLLPIQLLWINLVTDSLPALALGMETAEDSVMERPPAKRNENIFAHGLGVNVVWQGLMIGTLALIAYALGRFHFAPLHTSIDPEYAEQYGRTMSFAVLSISQLFHAFNTRSRRSLFKVGFHTNKYMLGAFAASLFMVVIILATPAGELFKLIPLGTTEWVEVFLLSMTPLVICELVKLGEWIFRKLKKA